MPQQEAKEEAVRSAIAKLAGVDMGARLAALGLPAAVTVAQGLQPAPVVTLRAFGQDVAVNLAEFAMTNVKTGKPAGMTDRILILHYLLCEVPLVPSGTSQTVGRLSGNSETMPASCSHAIPSRQAPAGTQGDSGHEDGMESRGYRACNSLITYRDFTGGQFYWQPFLSRTAKPLVAKIGNDLEKLKKNLARFDWTPVPVPPGDFAVRVHAVGNLHVTLVYTLGDEEFPASCEVLFDAATRRVYGAEDAAAMASRICIGLM